MQGASADAREGVLSFLEKRPASFPGKVSADLQPQTVGMGQPQHRPCLLEQAQRSRQVVAGIDEVPCFYRERADAQFDIASACAERCDAAHLARCLGRAALPRQQQAAAAACEQFAAQVVCASEARDGIPIRRICAVVTEARLQVRGDEHQPVIARLFDAAHGDPPRRTFPVTGRRRVLEVAQRRFVARRLRAKTVSAGIQSACVRNISGGRNQCARVQRKQCGRAQPTQ